MGIVVTGAACTVLGVVIGFVALKSKMAGLSKQITQGNEELSAMKKRSDETAKSLEEKFQQGVGTNLELDAFLDEAAVARLRARVAALARALGVEGYARLDLFLDRARERLVLLEPNTLCGLTEATVFYSQAASSFGLAPPAALARVVEAGLARARRAAGAQPAGASSSLKATTSMPAR